LHVERQRALEGKKGGERLADSPGKPPHPPGGTGGGIRVGLFPFLRRFCGLGALGNEGPSAYSPVQTPQKPGIRFGPGSDRMQGCERSEHLSCPCSLAGSGPCSVLILGREFWGVARALAQGGREGQGRVKGKAEAGRWRPGRDGVAGPPAAGS